MKRIHPMLAVALVALAVLLVTLALAYAIEGTETVAVGPRAPGSTDVDVIPYIHGHAIYPGSEQCAPRGPGGYVPTESRARYIRAMTRLVIITDIETGALTTPLSYEVWRALLSIDFGQRFLDRPLWGQYATPPGYTPNCGIYYCACAAGVGTLVPQIDTSDPARIEPLLAWEVGNATLGILQRSDKWDGTYVSSVNNRVAAIVGGWQKE